MAENVTRVPYEEFAADVARFFERVSKTGDRIEVLWEHGTVALIRPERPSHAEAEARTVPERWRVARSLSEIPPLTPEQIEQRKQALARIQERGKQLAAQRRGTPAPSNAELVRQLREERSRELEERMAPNRP